MNDDDEEQSTRRRSSVVSNNDENNTQNVVAIYGEPNDLQQPHRSLLVRAIWFTIGIISLGLGGVGIILPGLPTTPFILLSSFAFLRSSETFYNWLVHSKVFGPIITQWAEHRALPSKRVKVVGLICTVSCFSASVIYFAAFSNYSWASLILGMLCVAVCIFLIRLPVVAMI